MQQSSAAGLLVLIREMTRGGREHKTASDLLREEWEQVPKGAENGQRWPAFPKAVLPVSLCQPFLEDFADGVAFTRAALAAFLEECGQVQGTIGLVLQYLGDDGIDELVLARPEVSKKRSAAMLDQLDTFFRGCASWYPFAATHARRCVYLLAAVTAAGTADRRLLGLVAEKVALELTEGFERVAALHGEGATGVHIGLAKRGTKLRFYNWGLDVGVSTRIAEQWYGERYGFAYQ